MTDVAKNTKHKTQNQRELERVVGLVAADLQDTRRLLQEALSDMERIGMVLDALSGETTTPVASVNASPPATPVAVSAEWNAALDDLDLTLAEAYRRISPSTDGEDD